jgi:hypothetical protein
VDLEAALVKHVAIGVLIKPVRELELLIEEELDHRFVAVHVAKNIKEPSRFGHRLKQHPEAPDDAYSNSSRGFGARRAPWRICRIQTVRESIVK